jgi:dTDP-4-dehydrorhamnose 3,5-epimerase-like enzyme
MEQPKIIKGGISTDDRGTLSYVNDFTFSNVKRFYQIENHSQGFIRAWHGHKKEAKYFYVNQGAILIGAVNLGTDELFRFTLSSNSPSVLYIPAGYANGIKNLTNNTIITVFSTTTLQESLDDDYRFPYDKWNIWDIDFR